MTTATIDNTTIAAYQDIFGMLFDALNVEEKIYVRIADAWKLIEGQITRGMFDEMVEVLRAEGLISLHAGEVGGYVDPVTCWNYGTMRKHW